MESIYIMEPGSYVRREGNALCVVKQGKVMERIPAEGLKRLILVGNVNLTGPVLDFLIHRQVETVFMTQTGRFRARLGIDEHRHVALRKAQYQHLSDPAFAARTARTIVAGKLRNMIRLMLLRGRQYDDEILRTAAAGLKPLSARLKKEEDLERIRGFEGAATRIYFQCFRRLIRNNAFAFNGRNRRPPLDPVNAMLSFVYTLLTNEVASAISACGLDPYMGALHEISYGRPSLACDLVEEYRVLLGDRLVLGLVNRKAIAPEDFILREGKPQAAYVDEAELASRRPVEMRPPVRRAFVGAYEQMMKREINTVQDQGRSTYRRLIMHQVRRFAEYLQNPAQAYAPFVLDI
jgi:CRISPR-associated protein Cas1